MAAPTFHLAVAVAGFFFLAVAAAHPSSHLIVRRSTTALSRHRHTLAVSAAHPSSHLLVGRSTAAVARPRHILAVAADQNSTSSTAAPSTISVPPAASPAPAPVSSPAPDTHRNRVRNWIVGFAVGTVAGVISGLFLTVIYRVTVNYLSNRLKDRSGPTIFLPKFIKKAEYLAFLDAGDAAAALSSLEVIGRGGCGEVYKATLPRDSPDAPPKEIAIKKITKRSPGGAATGTADIADVEESRLLDRWTRQIRSEIITVGRIRHRNLLPLAAHVPRPDCHYLVYEYMRNGSLRDALQGRGGFEFPWPARHRAALGAAAGLEYLHFQHWPPIIHRDLKPANILLDGEMEARITDFGLAKELPEAQTHATSSRLAGTLGYIAPEYHQTLQFTAKCDVYSFGVILAALVVGKEPADGFFQETREVNMVKWVRNVMASESPRDAIDGRLAGGGWEEEMMLVLRVACFCTDDDPKARPDSKELRLMLAQINH